MAHWRHFRLAIGVIGVLATGDAATSSTPRATAADDDNGYCHKNKHKETHIIETTNTTIDVSSDLKSPTHIERVREGTRVLVERIKRSNSNTAAANKAEKRKHRKRKHKKSRKHHQQHDAAAAQSNAGGSATAAKTNDARQKRGVTTRVMREEIGSVF